LGFLEDGRYPELLERARARGATAEIYLRQTQSSEIVVHGGRVENRQRSELLGMGLRVEKDGRLGHASTTELGASGLEECLDEALGLAALAEPQGLPSIPELGSQPQAMVDLGGQEILDLDLEQRIDLARAAEEAAFAVDPRIRKSESSRWTDTVETLRILNSHGLERSQRRGEVGLSVDLVAEAEGEERSAYHHEQARGPAQLDPVSVGENAARKALSLLGSRIHATARAPVLLHHEVVADLLELLSESFSARSCLLGTSMLAGSLGRRVAASGIELVDDPFHPLGVGGCAFDDEGVEATPTVLLEGGVLRSYLHNSHTSRRMAQANTANAARESFASSVGVAPSILVLRPGEREPSGIIRQMGHGFHVSAVMGLHMADTMSGDFSLGIVGRVIEGGELGDPIEGMTIAGNLLTLLEAVEELAADYHPHADRGCPSLLVGSLTVSGR